MALTRRELVGLLGSGALAAAAGPALWSGTATASVAPPDLVIATGDGGYGLQNLSPFESGETAQRVLELLYDPGMVFDPLTGEPMPWAFTDWERDDDGSAATATLREGLTWTDGEAVTAGDVAFTVGELTSGGRSFVFGELEGFETGVVEDVRAVDRRTVAYEFGEPAGHWQAPLATPILPEHVWADVSNPREYRPMEADGEVVGSSPYRVLGFESGAQVTLGSRSDAAEYPMVDGRPAARAVRFQAFGSRREAAAAVSEGDAHAVLGDVDPGLAREVGQLENVDVVASPSRWYDTLGFNLRRVPFDDRAFRQLLARVADVGLAADHQGVAPGDLPIPDAFPHLRPAPPGEVDGFPFPGMSGEPVDVDAARSFLLQHADATHGYSFEPGSGGDAPDGAVLHVDGVPLGEAHTDNGGTGGQGPLVVSQSSAPSGFTTPFLEKLVADLRRVGVPVERQVVAFPTLVDSVFRNEQFDAYLIQWGATPIGSDLRTMFHSENADRNGSDGGFALNATGYGGADGVLDRLRSTASPDERVELLQAAAQRVYEDCPAVFPAYGRHVQPVTAAWTDHVRSPEGIVNRYSLLGARSVRTPPDPAIAVSPSTPQVGETVTFDAAGTEAGEGEIRRYAWDLDMDGTTDGEGATFETSFDDAGEYIVRLTVVDEFGARGTTERTVAVASRTTPTAPAAGEPDGAGGGTGLAVPLGVGGLLAAGGAAALWRRGGGDASDGAGGPPGGRPSTGRDRADAEPTDAGPDDEPDDAADAEPAEDTAEDEPTEDAAQDAGPSPREGFEDAVGRGEAAADEADAMLAQGNLDGAEDAFQDALDAYEAARERAADANIEDAAAVAGVESTEAQLRKVDRRRLAADVDDIAARVDDAEDDLDTGALEDAADAFEAAREEAESLAAAAREDGFGGVATSAEDLSERCETGLAAVEDARERADRPGPPASIPEVPRADLSYDDLERGELVGKGGNADVYRATATVDGRERDLAVKEPRFSGTLHAETVERFAREAETWAKLDDHDHVVTVVDYGERPLPWIAMEYMDAGGLGERLGAVGPREATWYGACMARALKHAHRRGVSHLDLKPANVLFRETPGDDWDVPKVADWGLAKMLLEHSNSIEGLTPQYAAPEQLDDEGVVDHQTDVYQLGAVLYELYTGEPVHTGSAIQVVRKVVAEPVTPPTEVDPSLPSAVDDVLLRALAKDRGDRYEDLIYLRDDLEELLAEL